MKWRSRLAILMMVVGLSTQAHGEVVLETDDNSAVFTGTWTQSTGGVGFYGTDYAFAQGGGSVDTARFMTQILITSTATWCIQASWTDGPNRTTAAQYQVFDGPTLRGTFTVNQRVNGGAWRHLGCVKLTAGNTGEVRVSDAGVSPSSIVVADAVRWVWDERPLLQDFCVAVNGGFGSGGTTFVGKEFIPPTNGTCKPWAGIVKTASTVVGTSTGAACLSDDSKLLTMTLQTTDPEFFGSGKSVTDHIELCPRASTLGCPASSGQFDHGSFFSGPAAQVTCTTAVTSIPSAHD
jgi:hypothetical protein